MAHTTLNHSLSPTLTQRFGAWRVQMAEAAAQRNVYKTTVRELADLTNRELADLGIHRSEIKAIALEAAYGK